MPNHRLLIIDDSLTIRAMIEQIFAKYTDIKVVGVANGSIEAIEQIDRLYPDVLTLDIAMPGIDGLLFLEQMMKKRPIPVVIVSGLALPGNEICQKAVAIGASECFEKSKILSNAVDFVKTVRSAKVGKASLPVDQFTTSTS
jgi:chemotaxis response regulator CheB